jgi:hypothetical protein
VTPHFKFSLDQPPRSPLYDEPVRSLSDYAPSRPGYLLLTALDGETGWVKEYVPPTHLESHSPTPEWERNFWRHRSWESRGAA